MALPSNLKNLAHQVATEQGLGLTDVQSEKFVTQVMSKQLGIAEENVVEVASTMQAQRDMFRSNAEAFDNVSKALAETTKALTDIQATARAKSEEAGQSENNDQASAELASYLKRFDSKLDEKVKLDVLKGIRDSYGTEALLYAVEPDTMTKALRGSFKEGDPRKATAAALTSIHTALVAKGYLQTDGVIGDVPKYSAVPHLTKAVVAEMIDKMAASADGDMGYDFAEAKRMILTKADIQADATGIGAEWLPQETSREVITEVWENAVFGSTFRRIPMTSKTLRIPKVYGKMRMYLAEAPTELSQFFALPGPSSMLSSDDVTLTAKSMVGIVGSQQDLEDDALFSFTQIMRDAWGRDVPRQIDDLVLNGSTSLTDLDNANADGSNLWNNSANVALADSSARQDRTRGIDHRFLADGIRKYAADNNSAYSCRFDFNSVKHWSDAASNTAFKLGMIKMVHKLGTYADNAFWAMSPAFLATLLLWEDYLTVDKVGQRATLLSGVPMELWGHRVVRTMDQKDHYNASGVYDASTKDKTLVHLINPAVAVFGDRKRFSITSSSRTFLPGLNAMATHMRLDFKTIRDPNAEGCPVVEGYDMAQLYTA